MKKMLSIILTVTMMLTMVIGANVFADTVVADGNTTDQVIAKANATTIAADKDGSWNVNVAVFIKGNENGKPGSEATDANPLTVVNGSIVASTGVLITKDGNPISKWSLGSTDTEFIVNASGNGAGTYTVQFVTSSIFFNNGTKSDYVTITVLQPDTTPPVITIGGYNTNPTNQDVVVTATTNEGSLNESSHTFTANGSFEFVATDAAGNKARKTVEITNIDKTLPEITVPNIDPVEATGKDGAVVNFTVSATDNFPGSVSVVCAPASGSVFSLGANKVTCTATDAVGNVNTSSFFVNVVDTTAPEINVPNIAPVEATSKDGAIVTYTATATDLVDGDVPVEGSPESGSIFALGENSVSLLATDNSKNTNEAGFIVKVVDTTKPVMVDPTDITVEANGINSTVNLVTPSATDIFDVSVTNNAPATYPLGTTKVLWTATDANGNTTTKTQLVTVVDTTAPDMADPTDITVEANGVLSTIDLTAPEATDIFEVSVTNNAPITYKLGTTEVKWTATDANGNATTKTQKVTVVDTTKPVMADPTDITVEANGVLSIIDLTAPEATDIFEVSITNNAPITYKLGTTEVQWTATDANGNATTKTQKVTVVDTTKPVMADPTDITVEANGVLSTIDLTAPEATDIFEVSVINNAPATYPLGTTEVQWKATDANGNATTKVQKVTVVDTTLPVFTFVPASKTVFATGITTKVDIGLATSTDIFGTTITNNAPAVFPIGSTTITWTATDGNGLVRTATQVITVKYNFTGFFQPIDMNGVVNTVKAGSAIPVKFRLNGNMGLNVIASTSLANAIFASNTLTDDVETVLTAGGSSLSYDSATDTYTYVWKTDKAWVGQSKQFILKLIDGTTCTANFKFK